MYEISCLDLEVSILFVGVDKQLVKQGPRRMHPDLTFIVEAKVDKFIKSDFIRELQYVTWLANIVPSKSITSRPGYA